MRPPRPLLVTGFEPFGGDDINPSGEVARALHGRTLAGVPVIGIVLPCLFGASIEALRTAIDAHRPQLALALGLAADREGFTLERIAINVDDARIADNAGAQPIDRPVVPRGPAAYFTTLPIKAMVVALRDAGWPASVSQTAGTFVCNHLFYGLQHLSARRRGMRSGFMHLPCLPRQAHEQALPHPLPLQVMIEGVVMALFVAMNARADLAETGGQIA